MHTNRPYADELQFAKELAIEAKVIAMQYYKPKPGGEQLDVITKVDKSPVTIADETINQMVIDAVAQRYPADGVLGEEQSSGLDKPRLWVCDPIDGTVSFIIGEPEFMFSLALVENGKPVMAVVGDLANGDVFTAIAGQGAFLNDQPMHVSNRPLAAAWLAFPTNLTTLLKEQRLYCELQQRSYQQTMIHPSVFKGMLVAQGLCDGSVWSKIVHPWDAAAVQLMVTEAGGRCSDFAGGPHRYDNNLAGGFVVSNGLIHDELLEIARRTSLTV